MVGSFIQLSDKNYWNDEWQGVVFLIVATYDKGVLVFDDTAYKGFWYIDNDDNDDKGIIDRYCTITKNYPEEK